MSGIERLGSAMGARKQRHDATIERPATQGVLEAMTTNHTPGPWDVSENINNRLKTDVTARGGEDWLADCGTLNGLGAEVCTANARLMSASPDLMEALEKSRDLLCALLVWGKYQHGPLPFQAAIEQAIKDGYAALQKAGHPYAP